MHLGGVTPTPEHEGIVKTALGAERSVPWTHHPDGAAAAASLRGQGLRLWALEGGPNSISLFDIPIGPREPPILLVLGHEVAGIDVRILELCDRVLRLPMLGIKGSLNVSVAFGVAAYLLRFGPTTTIESRLP
jgi:tRNA G18 (ribose-2'-O)-methylase SpoU